MRKQELIHIHGLLVVTRRYLADQGDGEIPEAPFEEYDDYGVGPAAIAERKDTHKEAIDQLLIGLLTTLGTHETGANASSGSSESIDTSPTPSS